MKSIPVVLYLASLATVVLGGSHNTCSNPLYQSLSGYPPAKAFCERNFPQPVVTVTGSPGLCRSIEHRDVEWSTLAKGSHEALWSSLKAQADHTLSAVCACVNPPKTTIVYPTKTTKSRPEATTTKSKTWTISSSTSRSTRGNTSGTTQTSASTSSIIQSTSTSTSTGSSTRSPISSTKTSTTQSTSLSITPSTAPSTTRSTTSSITQSTSRSTTPSTTPLTTRSTTSSTTQSTSRSTTPSTTPLTTRSTTPPTTASTTTTTTSVNPNCPSPPVVSKDCQPGSCSRQRLGTCSPQPNELACQQQCNTTPGCVAESYSNTGYCSLYGDCQCPTTCGADRPSPAIKDCQPGSCQRREISCSLQTNNAACQTKCDNTPGCVAVNYNGINGYCVTYGDCTCPSICGTDRPSPALKDCQPGSCQRREISCSLQTDSPACQTNCNNTPGCIALNFNPNNDYCVTYGDCTCPTTCGADRPSPPQKDCQPGFCSRREISCSLQKDNNACQTNCNNTPGCIAVIYNGNNGYCTIYGDCTCPTTCGSDRPAPAQKDCQPGTCSRRELSCSLQKDSPSCQTSCNNTPGCIALNYNPNNDYCVTYGDCTCPAARMKLARGQT